MSFQDLMLGFAHVQIETLIARGVDPREIPGRRRRTPRQMDVPVELIRAPSRDVRDSRAKSTEGGGLYGSIEFGHGNVITGLGNHLRRKKDAGIVRGLCEASMKRCRRDRRVSASRDHGPSMFGRLTIVRTGRSPAMDQAMASVQTALTSQVLDRRGTPKAEQRQSPARTFKNQVSRH